jgi:MYXO-CTERM domain-containing protein
MDSDCGATDSGRICDTTNHMCTSGCHMGGNGCPSPLVCNASGSAAGQCVTAMDMSVSMNDLGVPKDMSANANDMAQASNFGLKGGGFGCDVGAGHETSTGALVLLALALLGVVLRRRESR